MDLARLRSGELLVGGSAVALLVVLFVPWFDGESGWSAMSVIRVFVLATIALALLLVALTITQRPVAVTVAAAVGVVTMGALDAVLVAYRVALDEPGPNAQVGLDAGAYLGLALAVGVFAGAWRTLRDERTD
ncbi:MAG: hypothetical protein M3296_07135, partial [Actinomycetota bacterium]|nr:hypothetical protein [Actinomycetota bacterium]